MAELTIKLTEKMLFDRQRCNENSDCSECSCWMANSECLFNFTEERKVGKWVKKSQYGNDYCSECNYEHCGYGYPKFCPNCGADMRGAENE